MWLKQYLGDIYSRKHINKEERCQINGFSCHLKKLYIYIEPKVNRREIIKNRMEINELKTRKTIGKKKTTTMKPKAGSLRR